MDTLGTFGSDNDAETGAFEPLGAYEALAIWVDLSGEGTVVSLTVIGDPEQDGGQAEAGSAPPRAE